MRHFFVCACLCALAGCPEFDGVDRYCQGKNDCQLLEVCRDNRCVDLTNPGSADAGAPACRAPQELCSEDPSCCLHAEGRAKCASVSGSARKCCLLGTRAPQANHCCGEATYSNVVGDLDWLCP